MSAKRSVKARKMWADRSYTTFPSLAGVFSAKEGKDIYTSPVYVLPADAASYDAMVEQMAQAYYERDSGAGFRGAAFPVKWKQYAYQPDYRERAVYCLAAIGITRPAKTGK